MRGQQGLGKGRRGPTRRRARTTGCEGGRGRGWWGMSWRQSLEWRPSIDGERGEDGDGGADAEASMELRPSIDGERGKDANCLVDGGDVRRRGWWGMPWRQSLEWRPSIDGERGEDGDGGADAEASMELRPSIDRERGRDTHRRGGGIAYNCGRPPYSLIE
jgi:hypothetical protein